MRKKYAAIFIFCAIALLLVSCGKEKEIKRYDYDLSEYVTLDNWDHVKANFSPPGVCTEEEIDQAVFQILLTYGEEEEKENGTVEMYDRVTLRYRIYYKGEEMSEQSQDEYEIIIGYNGNGDIDNLLAKEMIGKKVGDICRVSYTFPETDLTLGSWAGETVEGEGKILAVTKLIVPECTDEMVAKIGDGFTSVGAFRKALKADMLEQKESAKAEAVIGAFMDGVTVKKYPQAETQAYVDRYIREIKTAAEEVGVTYVNYLKDYLKMTEEEVSEAAKKDARDRVKKDMACIQASRLLKVELSEKEYRDGLEEYYAKEKDLFDSIEDFETYYTKDIMWECIRWDKTFLKMLDEAVSVK